MTTVFLSRAVPSLVAATKSVRCFRKYSRHLCSKDIHGVQKTLIIKRGVFTQIMGGAASCSNGRGDADEIIEDISNMDEVKEAVLCREDELPVEGMKSFDLDGTKVLVSRIQGRLSAIGGKCSHYGAPLANGSVCGNRVRCPWHGACFNLETGDIEDFPGLDSVPKYDIEIEEGNVKVRAKKELFGVDKRTKPLAKRDENNHESFVVIGGGAAGATCVESLRQEGFTGRVVLVCREPHLPYDRPKLSKCMDFTPDKITLRPRAYYESGDIELMLGVSADNVDTESKVISLSNGEQLTYDKVFIATGGKPRTLDVGVGLAGAHVVRVPEDANAIAEESLANDVVVIGTSFVGMEAAAYLSSDGRAASVTVVGNTAVPFERSLGVAVGGRVQKLFEEKGVKFQNGVGVQDIEGSDGRVSAVVLDNGVRLPAGVVVMGIGVVPETSFLQSSGLALDQRGYVQVNETLESNVPGVFCGGDIASFPLALHDGASTAIGHWQVAHGHGRTAALNMLGRHTPLHSVPFFWSVLYGKSLRYTGHGAFDDVIIAGDLEELSFIAYYCLGDRVVALASLGKDPAAAKYADKLAKGEFLSKEQVVADGDVALKLNN